MDNFFIDPLCVPWYCKDLFTIIYLFTDQYHYPGNPKIVNHKNCVKYFRGILNTENVRILALNRLGKT